MDRNSLERTLKSRREDVWRILNEFAALRDAHGVHDMAVEIQGIELMLKVLAETPDSSAAAPVMPMFIS